MSTGPVGPVQRGDGEGGPAGLLTDFRLLSHNVNRPGRARTRWVGRGRSGDKKRGGADRLPPLGGNKKRGGSDSLPPRVHLLLAPHLQMSAPASIWSTRSASILLSLSASFGLSAACNQMAFIAASSEMRKAFTNRTIVFVARTIARLQKQVVVVVVVVGGSRSAPPRWLLSHRSRCVLVCHSLGGLCHRRSLEEFKPLAQLCQQFLPKAIAGLHRADAFPRLQPLHLVD